MSDHVGICEQNLLVKRQANCFFFLYGISICVAIDLRRKNTSHQSKDETVFVMQGTCQLKVPNVIKKYGQRGDFYINNVDTWVDFVV